MSLRVVVKKSLSSFDSLMRPCMINQKYIAALRESLTLTGLPLVLSMHDVSDFPSPFLYQNYLTISPRRIVGIIDYLSKFCWFVNPKDITSDKSLYAPGVNREKVPVLLTFDDGFSCLARVVSDILRPRSIVPLLFVNSEPIMGDVPLLSSFVIYLNQKGINSISHLAVRPALFLSLVSDFYAHEYQSFLRYQGDLLSPDDLSRLVDSEMLVLGNHLSNHWNAKAQDESFLAESFSQCEEFIRSIQGFSLGLFAYPNGQPGSCFADSNFETLKQCGASLQFANAGFGKGYNLDNVLPRIGVLPWEGYNTINRKMREIISNFSTDPLSCGEK